MIFLALWTFSNGKWYWKQVGLPPATLLEIHLNENWLFGWLESWGYRNTSHHQQLCKGWSDFIKVCHSLVQTFFNFTPLVKSLATFRLQFKDNYEYCKSSSSENAHFCPPNLMCVFSTENSYLVLQSEGCYCFTFTQASKHFHLIKHCFLMGLDTLDLCDVS